MADPYYTLPGLPSDLMTSQDVGSRQLKTAIHASDTAVIDAFGRMRVSNPATLFTSAMQYDKQPLLWAEKIEGGGTVTHKPFESAADLQLTTASGDRVVRQTREYFNYQPGKSHLVIMTGVFGEMQEGTEKLIGYGDDKNGIFFGQDGGGMFMLLRTNVSGTVDDSRKVYQHEWCNDKMDGQGESRERLDPTKAQIFLIDIEWLGVGRVRMGFVIGGIIHYAHCYYNANREATTTYMTTATLPVRYEIKNTAAVAAQPVLKQICCQVASEGGQENVLDYPFSALVVDRDMPLGPENAIVIFAARHASTFNGIENRGSWTPGKYEVLTNGGRAITQMIYNPTLTGGTFNQIDPRSFIEGATDVTSYANGITVQTSISSGAGPRSATPVFGDTFTSRLPFGLDVDGQNPVSLALIGYALEANVTASFAFQWKELR